MIRKRNFARAFKKSLKDPAYAAQVLRKRFASYMSYRFGSGKSAWPETVSLFVTYACNLRCKMCGQWGEDGWARKLPGDVVSQVVPIERLELLVDDIAKFKPAITLFGGEPFLYPEWERLVGYIKSKGLRVNVVTNGTVLGKIVDRVVDSGIDELIFSLDGPEEIHDEIRSGAGIFKKATAAFTALNELKKARNVGHPKVNVNTTIFETNYQRLPEVVKVADSIGADAITFHHLIFQSHDICAENSKVFKNEFGLSCNDWEGFAVDSLPDIDSEILIKSLHELKTLKSEVSITVYPNYPDEEIVRYYSSFDFVSDSYNPRCISPWTTAYIFPNGDVKSCLDVCFIAGNINKERFSDIWNNDSFKHYRSVVKRRGYFPACTRCTEFYRS